MGLSWHLGEGEKHNLGWTGSLDLCPTIPLKDFALGPLLHHGPDWWMGDRYRRFDAVAMLKVRNLGEFEARYLTTWAGGPQPVVSGC